MKKIVKLYGLKLIFFIAISMLFGGCASFAFKEAKEINTIAGYDNFIKEHYDEPEYVYKAKKLRRNLLSPKQKEYEDGGSYQFIDVQIIDKRTNEKVADDNYTPLWETKNGVVINTSFKAKITSLAKYNDIQGYINFNSKIKVTKTNTGTVSLLKNMFAFSGSSFSNKRTTTSYKNYVDKVKFKLSPGKSKIYNVSIGGLEASNKRYIGGNENTKSKLVSFTHDVKSRFNK